MAMQVQGNSVTLPEERQAKLCQNWLQALSFGNAAKKDFSKAARLAMKFYTGKHNVAFDGDNDLGLEPTNFNSGSNWRVTTNKTFEMVQIFGPALYFKVPTRSVEPREVGDPDFADILERYQNYTINEFDHRIHARHAVQEGLIKGRGVLWTGLDKTGHATSTYQNVDYVQIDPDARTVQDAMWMARLRVMPIWKARKKFGKKATMGLKPNITQSMFEAASGGENPATDVFNQYVETGVDDNHKGKTKDMVMYWEIYSKMGMGTRLKMDRPSMGEVGKDEQENDFWMVAVAPGHNKLLSLSTWHTPYWADTATSGWPCTFLDFHPIPGRVWPMSHLQPAFGEQIFLDWAYSFLAQKAAHAGRNVVIAPEGLKTEAMSILRNDYGADFQIMQIPDFNLEKGIDSVIKLINFDDGAAKTIADIIGIIEQSFERRTGLSEILYGSTQKQMRSAAEANVKDANAKLRVDDMADVVEQWESDVARKEAIAARFHVSGQKIAEIMGPEAGWKWGQYAQGDIHRIVREYSYKIEGGSARRPNLEVQKIQADMMIQQLMPLYLQTESWLAVNSAIAHWHKANQIPGDVGQYLIPLAMYQGVPVPAMQFVSMQVQAQQAMAASQAQAAAQEVAG